MAADRKANSSTEGDRSWGHWRRLALVRYGGAAAFFVMGALLRIWLDPALEGAGFAITLTTMLLIAWQWGLGPCLATQVLTLVFGEALFGSSPEEANKPLPQALAGVAAFFLVGIFVAVLSESSRAARRRAQREADEAVSQREQLRTTLDCIGDAVIVTDDRGHLTMMNPVAETLTGWILGESLGRPLDGVFCLRHE